MRDEERIARIAEKLAKVWELEPDLRFFQLLSAIPLKDVCGDLFYYEDDALERSLDAIIKEGRLF